MKYQELRKLLKAEQAKNKNLTETIETLHLAINDLIEKYNSILTKVEVKGKGKGKMSDKFINDSRW